MTPIGVGGAAYVWSSIATDWQVKADTVALVTGTLSEVVSATGCVCGGWIADKIGRWWAFFGSGTLMAIVTLVMSISAYRPANYVTGVLFYAFIIGLCYAAFSAIVLHAIGRGLASTKYALFTSIGNIAPVYIIAFDGWIHDAYNTTKMLQGETVLGIGFIIISLFALSKLKLRKN